MASDDLITLTVDIVSSHLANNTVAVGDVTNLIQQVHGALAGLGAPAVEEVQDKVPVISIRSSIKPDHLVCMECGKRQKTLKRHLQTAHGMTPGQYRKDYGLPDTYPMVAPEYSERRSGMAKAAGFGRKAGAASRDAAGAASAAGKPAPKARGRRKKASD